MADLHDAAYHGDLDAVRNLLRMGEDANGLDDSGYSSLHWAAFKGHCGGDYAGVVRALLDAGADVDALTEAGVSALVLACRSGAATLVRLVVEAGADVNRRCGNETPLAAAAQAGSEEAVRLLLARGADRAAPGPFGLTALEWAEAQGFDQVVAILRGDG